MLEGGRSGGRWCAPLKGAAASAGQLHNAGAPTCYFVGNFVPGHRRVELLKLSRLLGSKDVIGTVALLQSAEK